MEKLIQTYAKQLRLPYLTEHIGQHLEQARTENSTYEEFLLQLFEYEIQLRKQNSINNRLRQAKFPYAKQLETLDISALPDEAQLHFQTLRSLSFIEQKQNIIFAGNPGTGKTHLAIGLGIKACQNGHHVYFAHVPTLIIQLKEAKSERVFQRLKSKFDKYQLIILDELGYISFDKEGAELLFNFLSTRCEKASTIFTTNLPFSRWDEIFHDPIITAAMVDRITHNSYVINMNGASFRMKESSQFIQNQLNNLE